MQCYQGGQENLAACTALPGTTNTKPLTGTNCQSSACSAEHLSHTFNQRHQKMVELFSALSHYHRECKAEVSKRSVTRKYILMYCKGLVEGPFMNMLLPRWDSSIVARLTWRLAAPHVEQCTSRRFFFLQVSSSVVSSLEMENENPRRLKKMHSHCLSTYCMWSVLFFLAVSWFQ